MFTMGSILSKRKEKAQKYPQTDIRFQKWLSVILFLGVAFLNVKKMFMDFDIDTEYAITMSYRLAMGDHMFSQMREPHQTSAFLLAFFIRIWMSTVGTTTGLVMYLNIVSLAIKFIIISFFTKHA